MKDLILEIDNFGPINKAKIDIGKISIIAGNNATGKTTSSKIFYSLLSSASQDGTFLLSEDIKKKLEIILATSYNLSENQENKKTNLMLTRELNKFFTNLSEIEEIYNKIHEFILNSKLKENSLFLKTLDNVKKIFDISNDKYTKFNHILSHLLKIEFDGYEQIQNNYSNSIVRLYQGKECILKVQITEDGKIAINIPKFEQLYVNEVIYIETPYIFDMEQNIPISTPFNYKSYHQRLLLEKLKDNKYNNELNKKTSKIKEKIDDIIGGYFKYHPENGQRVLYQEDREHTNRNTSSGLKQMGFLQTLIYNGHLPEDGFLVMDEPEVHLHPEWQIKLAEIIVILAKELNIVSYINSHSPQFIEAIEVYSIKYGIGDETNFYLTEKLENTNKFNFRKIKRNNLKEIYDNLGAPYDEINDIRMENVL